MNPCNNYHIKNYHKTKKSNLCHLVQMSLSLSNQFLPIKFLDVLYLILKFMFVEFAKNPKRIEFIFIHLSGQTKVVK